MPTSWYKDLKYISFLWYLPVECVLIGVSVNVMKWILKFRDSQQNN